MSASMPRRSQSRILRACDACTRSKQRCDGQTPCRRCAERNDTCHYFKVVHKRGRRPRSNSTRDITREDQGSFAQNSPRASDTSPNSTVLSSSTSTQEASELIGLKKRRQSELSYHANDATRIPTRIRSPAGATFAKVNNTFSSSNDVFDGVFPSSLSDTRLEARHIMLEPESASIDSGGPLSAIPQPMFSNPLSDRISTRKPYHCLEPLLPSLKGILSPDEASKMLEVYFNEENTSFFKSTSPYMLAHVLHPASVLHPTDPRPTSPALLVVILFSVAQTADMRIFDTPGARERISVDLYRLSLDLLQSEDPDNYFRTTDGWQFHPHPNNIPPSINRQQSGKTLLPRQLGSTDIILAVAILTITISGGHYKADSLKWKDKLSRLVRASGLSMEDQDIDLGPVFCGLYNGDATFRRWMIAKEERRRLFWMVYCLDRHLALSFNVRLSIPEGTFCVRIPLPEKLWQSLETSDLNSIPACPIGPPVQISGCGFFEYFLPLANILGHIIDLHHFRSHPTLGAMTPRDAIRRVESIIFQREQELAELESQFGVFLSEETCIPPFAGQSSKASSHGIESYESPGNGTRSEPKLPLVKAYSTYLLHVFYILLHGKWDPISMIEDNDDWITSESFLTCASHALSATGVVSQILTLDPELAFMPYLFGIYLLQGSFILLLFVDRMPELGPNRSVEEVCETIIRAHEVSVVTLDTTFQKNFRKVFRSMLYDAQQAGPHSWDEHKARRRELLSLYRWTQTAHGLAY